MRTRTERHHQPRNREGEGSDTLSSFQTYKRLLRFARPHLGRLLIGLLAGLISGGSVVAILHYSKFAIKPFDPSTQPLEEVRTDDSPSDGVEDKEAPEGMESIYNVARSMNVPVKEEDGSLTWQMALLMMAGVALSVLLKGFATFLNRYYMRWIGAVVVRDIRNLMFANLQRQSLSYFNKTQGGNLISRATNDTRVIEGAFPRSISELSRSPVEIVGAAAAIVMLAAGNPALVKPVIMLFIVFPICVVPIAVLGKHVKGFMNRALQGAASLVSKMQENVAGIKIVKAFNTEEQESRQFKAKNQRYFKYFVRSFRIGLLVSPVMQMIGVILGAFFLGYCYATDIALSQIIPLGVAGFMAYDPLRRLAKINVAVQQSSAAANRIFSVLEADEVLPEATHPVELTSFRDRITCRNVSFRYKPEEDDVLKDINLDIPVSSITAFVGETGAGKSTLVDLLGRFYDPTEGTICIDGTDMRELSISSLRRFIGVVTQETILFNDTIANNIAYGSPQADREQVVAAAKSANAHEFIMAHPEGYDRVVGDRGSVLSGGQSQRLAIARALLKNPPILILDEATSALDTATERLVQEAVLKLMKDRTVLAIAHRLSTVKHADQICVLNQGRIVEKGTHDELLEADGFYRRFVDMQFSEPEGLDRGTENMDTREENTE